MTAAETIRVLVVGDSTAVSGRTAETLRGDDRFDVTVRASAADALEWLSDAAVDCVVAEAELPGADGPDFLATVAERHGAVSHILLTDDGAVLDDTGAGGTEFVPNPARTAEEEAVRLAGRIELLVDHHRAQRRYERCEQHLRQQTDRLEEFTSIVSHDLRNPLNVAQSSMELLGDERDSDHIDRADRSLARMNAIIDDALSLVRQADSVDDPSPVDIERMARDAWSAVDTGEMELVVEASGRIEADAERLQELLGNLFENARQHGDATTVTVGSLSDSGGDFFVADDGQGIPEEQRDRAFESGVSTARGGTGLGLSIVERVAGAHGWTVTLTEADGGGARFEITGVTAR